MKNRVLWIEDQAGIIGNILSALEKDGFTKDIIRTRREYFEISDRSLKNYSLVIIDYAIPSGEKGVESSESICIEIIQDIRQNNFTIPIIVLTAYSETFTNMTSQMKLTNVHLLSKPIFPDEIKDEVITILGKDGK
jgi:DNA-binding NtrC family response regulator